MEFLSEYGMFLAKVLTFVVAIVLIIGAVASAGGKGGQSKLSVHSMNERFKALKEQIEQAVLPKELLKKQRKAEKAAAKQAAKADILQQRVYVLRFKGDIRASDVTHLREEISALLNVASDKDEVVVCLESGGGMVHEYGLAASQLLRIRERNIPLTVCVDKVAASGGYMMAVVANHIVAAPFAVIGSIGVIAQLPNFNRVLKKHDIDFEMHTAGEYKRTLTLFGENTDEARNKFREDLADVHALFKAFVGQYRPQLLVEQVANGDVWYGSKALEQGLVDELSTSDSYLQARCASAKVFEISMKRPRSVKERLGMAAEARISGMVERLLEVLVWKKWFL